ncbi:MAG: autotransporter-associated beta strand repeat-containing protein [Methylacidiphilales bacterium]|nr:autotransporter-associated beta strand repeat-containing protein [Candidatus Methylacidiphilales bacterium]
MKNHIENLSGAHYTRPRAGILLCLTALAAVFLLLAMPVAQASTLTWDNSGANPAAPTDGTTSLWDTTATVWSNTTTDSAWVNANNDTAVFGSNNGTAGTVNLGSAITAGGITFNAATSGNYTIAGGSGPFALTLAGATPTITANVNATISAGITGTVGLVKSGSGTLVLSGTNTYSGGTTINGGILSISGAVTANGSPSNIGTAGVTLDGGTLLMASPASLPSSFNRGITLGANGGTLQVDGALASGLNYNGTFSTTGSGARTFTLSGSQIKNNITQAIVDGTGGATSLVKAGSSDWTIGATTASTYTGTTDIQGGTLILGKLNALPTTTTLSVANGATLRLNGFNQTVASLSGAGNVTNNAVNTSTLTVGSGSFSGALQDFTPNSRILALAKNTAGTLRLSGNSNTYTGGTTISNGTLIVNNTLSTSSGLSVGAVSVTSATLGGNGYIALGSATVSAPTIAVGSGGIIAAGDGGIGTLTLNGANTSGAILDMQAGSKFTFDLGPTSTSDLVQFYNYAGAADFLRDSGGITLDFTGAQAGIYQLFKFYSNSGSTLVSEGFTQGTSNFTLGSGLTGFTAVWDYTTPGIISLNLTAVPEPSTYAMLLGGVGLLVVLRRLGANSRKS